ncbi:hypothetical protein [Streptomyces sp. NPDC056723]|uniref:hypothetical protein n=1 Tax=Streptomyces sp. NPDC056723 TaxID=3345925 RepID=UPI0036BD188C
MTAITVALGCLFAYLALAPQPTYHWQPAPAGSSSGHRDLLDLPLAERSTAWPRGGDPGPSST